MNCPLCQLRPGGLELTAKLISHSDLDPGSNVLDIGCGRGESLAFIKERYDCSCFGIEADQELCAEAKRNYPALSFYNAQAEELPFDDSFFDCILLECVISLFDQPCITLAEIFRVLKPGGKLLISDVYARSDIPAPQGQGMLRNIYTLEQNISMLENCGFTDISFADQSDCLKQMLGQMIFDLGLQAAYKSLGLDVCRLQQAKIGYALMVAGKK